MSGVGSTLRSRSIERVVRLARWAVRKRDGVWVALDHRGGLRYAADEWRKAVTFALLCGRPLPTVLLTPAQMPVIEFRQVSAEELGLSQENLDQMRKSIERIMRFHKRDEDGE